MSVSRQRSHNFKRNVLRYNFNLNSLISQKTNMWFPIYHIIFYKALNILVVFSLNLFLNYYLSYTFPSTYFRLTEYFLSKTERGK